MDTKLKFFGDVINNLLADRRSLERSVGEIEEELNVVRDKVSCLAEAQKVVQSVVMSIQDSLCKRIESVVAECLNVVFGDIYDFKIVVNRGRGKTEVFLVFEKDGVRRDDPMGEVGGGILDVASFALRLACIILSGKRKILVLDEPWKNIRGSDYKSRTRRMLLKLAKDLGFQFLLNTDIQEYKLGTVVEVD